MSEYVEKDGIKYILVLKFAFTAEKNLYYTIGVDVKLGMNTHLHCSASFLIRQRPVIEKYRVNSSNTRAQQGSTCIRAEDSRPSFISYWRDTANLESVQTESMKMIKALDA